MGKGRLRFPSKSAKAATTRRLEEREWQAVDSEKAHLPVRQELVLVFAIRKRNVHEPLASAWP